MKVLIIDNANHNRGKELRSLIAKHYSNIEIITTADPSGIPAAVNYAMNNRIDLLISAGGDGSINHLINEVMKRKKNLIKNIKFGVLPCGKANDLAKVLGIPKNLNLALKKILNGAKKEIDLIRVNDRYFITGGGFGLPSEVIKAKDNMPLLNFLKDKIYFFAVLKLFLLGYKGISNVKVRGNTYSNLMLYSIMNQQFIGKRFFLSPKAKDSDGYLDVCLIMRGKNIFQEINMLTKVLNKSHEGFTWSKSFKAKRLNVRFDKKEYFMGDGEIMEFSKKFDFSILRKEIIFLH